MSFSEQESVTIKRLEVAIRNSDMELLKEASYKLHEKFHEGYNFEMLQELSQILAYVSESEIPLDIKEILCPTIEEILDKATAPQNNNQIISVSEDAPQTIENTYVNEIPKEEAHQENAYTSESPKKEANLYDTQEHIAPEPQNIYSESVSDFSLDNQIAEPIVEIPQTVENQYQINNEETVQNDVQIQAEETPKSSVEIYEPTYGDNTYNEVQADDDYRERINTYQEQFTPPESYKISLVNYSENNPEPEKTEYNAEDGTVSEVYNEPIYEENKEEETRIDYAEEAPITPKEREQLAIFYYDKKSMPLSSSSNQIDELSLILDKVDTDVYDFEKLLKAIKEKKVKTQVVTTTQSIKLSEFLTQENISFTIPFVANTSGDNADFEIIPMYGLSNILKCQNCGAKILSYSFNNKVLSVKCSNCSDVMYPEIYSSERNINPYYWQRAFGALSGSKTWILLNLPAEDGLIKDFIETIYRNACPNKIYMFPENNYYEDFFSKANPNCEVITYQTQEKMISDLSYSENMMQAIC